MKQTKQKEVILNVVLSSCDHPDVETIYLRAKKNLPKIGIATVYRVLTSLAKEGKILKVSCETGDRYDKTLSPHAHFKCNKCNCVTDIASIDVESNLASAKNERKFLIESAYFTLTGICENCLNSN